MKENEQNKSSIEDGFVRKPDEPKTRNWQRTCILCGRDFYSVRKDSQFCSSYCRARYWRQKYQMKENTTEDEKTPKKGKKTLIGEYYRTTYWHLDDNIDELRNWLKRNLGIARQETTTFIKAQKAVAAASTDKVHYELVKVKYKVGEYPKCKLYKIELS